LYNNPACVQRGATVNTDQHASPSWWEENWIVIEMILCALGTIWLSLEALKYGSAVVETWQSCSRSGGVNCTPRNALGLGVGTLLGICILSYTQRAFMRFVGAMFFGVFLAGFCGIVGLFEMVYPWWVHASALVVGCIGASILLPDDKLDEILYGPVKEPTLLEKILHS
jgi:hypothetical protein